ncbi:MAG: ABC transporter ATP-binding protein [Desulfobacterales bacterium]|jgi:branched-chain amino acid transport system ATP-binding protein|nr:ABC transporter ATP-binding protein [Desulfobacterales bacterium]MDP6681836.1 ABC transporter ATP-binding protein [Desulfobacterales bacterium]MDP6808534.1 ABC transporter ATP-binding protein [Desulfobacterales bacterium]|tara:strand:+ start:25944 stop:26654 length:711 start_codon:yes stop_codon:yes gene_type:complete
MLKLISVESHYGRIRALKGISLQVPEGQIVALLGANGAGKSTTLRTISGLIRTAGGEILYQGQPIHHISPNRIVRLGICQVPEGRDIFMGLTVQENLKMGAFTRKDGKEVQRNLNRIYTSFPILNSRAKQMAGTLSGGEQQMLATARGLMSNPKLMLLDEPSLGLAPFLVEEIFHIIEEINREGVTILLVEQNANMALRTARYGYVMETGKIALHDDAESLIKNDYVRKVYLGAGD